MYTTRVSRGQSIFSFLSCLFFLFILSPSVSAATPEVESVREQIQKKGGKWLSAETSITKLPAAHRLKRLGLFKGPVSIAESAAVLKSLQTAPKSQAAPTYLNYYDSNYVTPIRDQGSCGSCWAFATTAALESQVLIATHATPANINLSEQVLVSCSGAGSCNGGYIDSASYFIQGTGLPTETCFPYSGTDNNCSNASCPYWQSDTDAIKAWHWVSLDSPTVTALKTALVNYGPLVTTMNVYADFFTYAGGVYSYATGAYQGGHAVSIIGYDDSSQCFIVKNSWGTDWGEKGFFRIAYSEVSDNRYVQFGYYTIAYDGNTPVQTTCSYSISPKSITVTYPGGNAVVSVTSQPGCSWTAVSNTKWINIVSGASGTDDGTLTYQVSPNNTYKNRTGKMTIAGKTLTVKQKAKPLRYARLWRY